MLESLFDKVTGLQACIFTKKRLQHRFFPVNIAKFFRTPTLKYICEQLLLYFWNPNYKKYNLRTSRKLHFQLLSFSNFSSTEFVFAFPFFSHAISNIYHNISSVLFFSCLNRSNAFSHYKKFVLIGNAHNLSSGFI